MQAWTRGDDTDSLGWEERNLTPRAKSVKFAVRSASAADDAAATTQFTQAAVSAAPNALLRTPLSKKCTLTTPGETIEDQGN